MRRLVFAFCFVFWSFCGFTWFGSPQAPLTTECSTWHSRLGFDGDLKYLVRVSSHGEVPHFWHLAFPFVTITTFKASYRLSRDWAIMVETRLWMDSPFMLCQASKPICQETSRYTRTKGFDCPCQPKSTFSVVLTFWEKYMETSFIRRQLSNQISTSVIHPWSRNLHQARFFSVKS